MQPHSMNRYKVPPCGVWAVCTRTHIERAQRYFKLSSSCNVALVLRYRAAWDNMHVCVCATGHLEHYWKLHGFALSSIAWRTVITIRTQDGRDAAPSGPRGPQTRAWRSRQRPE